MIIIFKNKNEKESFTKIVDIDTMVKHGADLIAISNHGNFDYVTCSPAGHTSPRKVDLESFKDLVVNYLTTKDRSASGYKFYPSF